MPFVNKNISRISVRLLAMEMLDWKLLGIIGCVNSMHGIRDCRSKAKCYKCRSVRHHTAICNTGETLVSNTRQYMDINREKNATG